MSSSTNNIYVLRRWMYERVDMLTNNVSTHFIEGLDNFMKFAANQRYFLAKGKMLCPCVRCQNLKELSSEIVMKHLFKRGFVPNYYIWIFHGEEIISNDNTSSRCVDQMTTHNLNNYEQHNPYIDMIQDGFPTQCDENREEEPLNHESKRFFDLLNAVNQPIYDGCKEGVSQLSMSARLMGLKTNYNLTENCMDEICQMFNDYLPQHNKTPESYYETSKLMGSLGMRSIKIDVCRNNCMIFWNELDKQLENCRFCGAERYKTKKVGQRNRVPHKRMFYLPIADRLRRLYESQKTAEHMRWHAEHTSDGESMSHPCHGAAWKHFNELYPSFASEHRNVYLCLCTDGFAPYGQSGKQYSLWPIVMSPYNLPPEMCLKKEFLFLTVMIPGPDHPKKSFDIFLQPLIDELNDLWSNGVDAYDVSLKQNFKLRAVLMWTISDFPAYGMLSGWSTHGRLACPYCMDDTQSFQLRHGKKSCWFDCHRRFLPLEHQWRRNKTHFTKNKIVREDPPTQLTGIEILCERISMHSVERTVDCGGCGHRKPVEFGESHNWYKKSIFWDLPYWKTHKLRHNLDVMHIEKNFFDNIIHTVMNVKGKSKDNVKSRMDLKDICYRKQLELSSDGKALVPVFRLTNTARGSMLKWLKDDVKFSDGYASNIGRCVNYDAGKLMGMKSHDCHVFMQRLIPIAFAELLPRNVYEPLCGISTFFRDMCCRTLNREELKTLKNNIPLVLCALERIFPPSFFDVMEHLTIHLPDEAFLGGPVQFRWMYPFERFFFFLKRKVKNKNRPEGAIVKQYVNEEISSFTTYYFEPHIRTKSRNRSRYDDDEFIFKFNLNDMQIPDMFYQTGRLSGKCKERWLSSDEYRHAHTYILLNCEELRTYEVVFDEQMKASDPTLDDRKLISIKEASYASWLEELVMSSPQQFPIWLQDVIRGPIRMVKCWPIMFTRGYMFHTFNHGSETMTSNFGICVKGSNYCETTAEPDFHGILQEIMVLEYHGYIGLKLIIFNCDWFDPTIGRGTRTNGGGGVDVNITRKYSKYDPFILSSQADQVCYMTYPSVKRRRDQWKAVIKIQPRVVQHDCEDARTDTPLQESIFVQLNVEDRTTNDDSILSIQLDNRIVYDNSLHQEEEVTSDDCNDEEEDSEKDRTESSE